MSPIESRRTKRKEITLKGNFRIKDDLKYKLHIYKEPIEITLIDVSVMGCGFATEYYLPKGLILNIYVKNFPVVSPSGARGAEDIEFAGRVMFSRTIPSRVNRIGLEFVDIKREHLDLIKRFVESSA